MVYPKAKDGSAGVECEHLTEHSNSSHELNKLMMINWETRKETLQLLF